MNSHNGGRAAVITVSDRVWSGDRDDTSGPVAAELLRASGWDVEVITVPDGKDAVAAAIRQQVDNNARLVVTTGGTGVGSRDVTPEATAELLDRQLPGIAEQIRRVGAATIPQAMLSRGLAGVCGSALVVNLAGSPGAVRDAVPIILQVAAHVVAQLAGEDHS